MPTPEIEETLDRIYAAATARGSYEESAQEFSHAEARSITETIVSVYSDLCELQALEEARSPTDARRSK
jgi:hypothetical protein